MRGKEKREMVGVKYCRERKRKKKEKEIKKQSKSQFFPGVIFNDSRILLFSKNAREEEENPSDGLRAGIIRLG